MFETPASCGALEFLGTAIGTIPGQAKEAQRIVWPPELSNHLKQEELSELWMPPEGSEAELQTLQSQSARAQPVDLDAPLLAGVVARAAQFYPDSEYVDPLSIQLYNTVVAELKTDSVSGYPYMLYAQQIEGVLVHPVYAKALREQVVDRLTALMKADPAKLRATVKSDPRNALQLGLADPLRVIIKKDPVTHAKIEERRWRFIMATSLADQLVERLLFSQQNKREIKLWKCIPSKPGMGAEDADAKVVRFYVLMYGLNIMSDVSGWDQTVPEQMLYADAERRILLCPNASQGWKNAVRNVMTLSAHKVVMLSDGRLYARKVPGAMASGRYCTSSSNSAMRVMCDMYVLPDDVVPHSMAMGDDCVSKVADKESHEKAFGDRLKIKLRDVTPFGGGENFEFCSHMYTPGGPVHMNPAKAIARVVALGAGKQDAVDSRRTSLEHEFRHVPEGERYLAALDVVNRA